METKHIDWTEVASFPRPLLGLICGVNEGKQSFVSCCGNQVVAMTPAGFRENYAGSGQAAHRDGFWHECRFAQPAGCCQRESTGEIFVCDAGNRRIRRIRDNERGTRVVGSPSFRVLCVGTSRRRVAGLAALRWTQWRAAGFAASSTGRATPPHSAR